MTISHHLDRLQPGWSLKTVTNQMAISNHWVHGPRSIEGILQMKTVRIFAIVLLGTVSLYLVGCCGGGKETVVERERVVTPEQVVTPTLGKQLEDLKKAYDSGTITKQEYEAGKKRLLGE